MSDVYGDDAACYRHSQSEGKRVLVRAVSRLLPLLSIMAPLAPLTNHLHVNKILAAHLPSLIQRTIRQFIRLSHQPLTFCSSAIEFPIGRFAIQRCGEGSYSSTIRAGCAFFTVAQAVS